MPWVAPYPSPSSGLSCSSLQICPWSFFTSYLLWQGRGMEASRVLARNEDHGRCRCLGRYQMKQLEESQKPFGESSYLPGVGAVPTQ